MYAGRLPRFFFLCIDRIRKRGLTFPCVFVVVLGMTAHSKNLTGVQKELWHLINDEDVKRVLEAMIDKMKEVGDSSERLKQWRQEAKAYIPTDKKYSLFDEEYWVAAYIIQTNIEKFIELFKKLKVIKYKFKSTENKVYKLEDEHEELRNRIEKLTQKIENSFFVYFVHDVEMLKKLNKQLERKLDKYEEILDRYYDLKDDKNALLEEMIEIAEQLVAS